MDYIQHFTETKNELLKLLQAVQVYVRSVVGDQIETDLSDAIEQLKNEKFEVIVVGEFSNGKSTFLNALLQHNVLPSASVPTTTLLNKIYYRSAPAYAVYFEDQTAWKLTPSQFMQFVSEDKREFDGPSEEEPLTLPKAKPTHLEIGYPASICQNNVTLIDSPGTNDMDTERVKITDEYIPKSDAAIFVLSAKKIFTDTERAFLQRIMDADVQKIFFVINFKDAIQTDEEFAEIEKIVLENLPESLKQPKVHFVSALHALQHYVPPAAAKSRRAQRRQSQRLPIEETGIIELEQALLEFLSMDQGREKLRRPIVRAKYVLNKVKYEYLPTYLQRAEHEIGNTTERAREVHEALNSSERQIDQHARKFQREIEGKSKEIMKWYKVELYKIIQEANAVMEHGIEQGRDPEDIKTTVALATGFMEKNMKTELQEKMNQMLKEATDEQQAQLEREIMIMQYNSDQQSSNWYERIQTTYSTEESESNLKIGAVVGGVATLILSGGMFGWAMLGAAGGALALDAYKGLSSESYGYRKLRAQVSQRYDRDLLNQMKLIEASLKRLAVQMKKQYTDVTNEKVRVEREKANGLLYYHELSEQEQQEMILKLKKDTMKCDILLEAVDRFMKDYGEIGKEGTNVQ